jgi:hypothetical protein
MPSHAIGSHRMQLLAKTNVLFLSQKVRVSLSFIYIFIFKALFTEAGNALFIRVAEKKLGGF